MFAELPESRRVPTRSTSQTALSILVHVVLIAVAARLTAAAASRTPTLRATDLPLFHTPPARPPVVRSPQPAHSTSSAIPAFAPMAIAAPVVVAPTLPPIDAGVSTASPRFAIGFAGPFGTGAGSESAVAGEAFAASQVDQPAEYLRGADPVYPPALQRAGVGGRVTVQYVVDSSGQVEPESFRILGTDQPAFAEAARAAILSASFRPARVRGRPVRQLVEQAVRFELHP